MLEPLHSDGVSLSVLSWRASVRIKSWLPEHLRGQGGVELGGRPLPSVVGTTTEGEVRVLCLGPGEWLLVSDAIAGSELRARIEREAAPPTIAVVDV
jgi:sarcosine oxidase gamma subunit